MSDRDAFEQLPYAPPPGATEIILVRHGASAAAKPGVRFELVEGRGNPPLSQTGKKQAELVAARLRNEPIDRAFMTPLQRTHQTAEPFLAATGLAAEIVPELIEVSLGDWEGGEYRVRSGRNDPIIQRMHERERWDVVPGAESQESLAARTRIGIERVVADTGPDKIAIVFAHGAVIGELCRQAAEGRSFAFIHSDNGSISRIVVQGTGRWLLRSFNEFSHLDALAPAS
ncbi:MAG: Phosphoglycerate mutase [Solirubrobacterales bacterium]|nr:Phosphoglycerate mutase [Solirubrobacterales bacterium]